MNEHDRRIIDTPTRELGPAGKLLKQGLINPVFTTNRTYFRIRERGWVVSVSADQIPDGVWDPGTMTGLTAVIDGEEFLIKGVEMFRPMISPENPYTFGFGILV
jgi:hypothetical protein